MKRIEIMYIIFGLFIMIFSYKIGDIVYRNILKIEIDQQLFGPVAAATELSFVLTSLFIGFFIAIAGVLIYLSNKTK